MSAAAVNKCYATRVLASRWASRTTAYGYGSTSVNSTVLSKRMICATGQMCATATATTSSYYSAIPDASTASDAQRTSPQQSQDNFAVRNPMRYIRDSLAIRRNLQGVSSVEDDISFRIGLLQYEFGSTQRVSKADLNYVINNLSNISSLSYDDALALLRYCGTPLFNEVPEMRTKRAMDLWKSLETVCKFPMDARLYNTLALVHLENGHPFDPQEFCAQMKEKGVTMSRVTYHRLIRRSADLGPEGLKQISEMLVEMKSKGMVPSEATYEGILLAHARAKDDKSFEQVFAEMKADSRQMTAENWAVALSGYAENGNVKRIQEIMERVTSAGELESFPCKFYMEMASVLGANGFEDEGLAMLDNAPTVSAADLSHVIRSASRLVSARKYDFAIKLMSVMRDRAGSTGLNMYWPVTYIFDHMILSGASSEEYKQMSEKLNEITPTSYSLAFFEACSHRRLDLMEEFLDQVISQQPERRNPEELTENWFYPGIALALQTEDHEAAKRWIAKYVAQVPSPLFMNDVRFFVSVVLPNYKGKMDDLPQLFPEEVQQLADMPMVLKNAQLQHLLRSSNTAGLHELMASWTGDDVRIFAGITTPLVAYWALTGDNDGLFAVLKQSTKNDACPGEVTTQVLRNMFSTCLRGINEGDPNVTAENIVAFCQRAKAENLPIYDSSWMYMVMNFVTFSESVSDQEKAAIVAAVEPLPRCGPPQPSARSLWGLGAGFGSLSSPQFSWPEMKQKYMEAKESGRPYNSELRMLLNRLLVMRNDELKVEIQQYIPDLEVKAIREDAAVLSNFISYFVRNEEHEQAYKYWKMMHNMGESLIVPRAARVAALLALAGDMDKAKEVTAAFVPKNAGNLAPTVRMDLTQMASDVIMWAARRCELRQLEQVVEMFRQAGISDLEIRDMDVVTNMITRGDYDGAIEVFKRRGQVIMGLSLFNSVINNKEKLASVYLKIKDLGNKNVTDVFLVAAMAAHGKLNAATIAFEGASPSTRNLMNDRLGNIATFYENSPEALRNILTITRGKSMPNRSFLYEAVLNSYVRNNDWKGARDIWDQIESEEGDETFRPSRQVMEQIEALMTHNNQPVPFVI